MVFKSKVSQGILNMIQKKEKKNSLRAFNPWHWDNVSRSKYFNTFYYAQLLGSSHNS